nr:transposase [Bacteroides intestinalis]
MVKIQKISEIEPRLGFTEFDMLKKYRQSFATSELGRLHALFPFSELARQMHLKSSALGRKSYFSPEGKIALMVLKSYTNFSDAQLIEHLNGNIHYQLFCGVQIDPLHPLTNPKIVSAIRQELADRLDIEFLQAILADHWKPYLENLHVCMTDATCYESHLQQQLTKVRVKALAADSIYANNANRKFCTKYHISTSFKRKGRAAKDEPLRRILRSELSRERATRLEGSFRTQKQHYSLARIKARNKKTEMLWIFFGIHTANAVCMIEKVEKKKRTAA